MIFDLFEGALKRLWPHGDSLVAGFVEGIVASAPSISQTRDSNLVIARAMAHFSEECGAGLKLQKNKNYSTWMERQILLKMWRSRGRHRALPRVRGVDDQHLSGRCLARRNELLALRWSDLNVDRKTLRIERALEHTKKFGIRIKPPKIKRGFRMIDLDDATIAVLLDEKEQHLRMAAGVPDGADVDLSLIRLPEDALMFPAISVSFTMPRHPRNFSRDFAERVDLLLAQARKADLPGFSRIRFHDLRGIHSTALLDAGIPVHAVA
jgi:integrase